MICVVQHSKLHSFLIFFIFRISQRHSLSGDLLSVKMILDLYTNESLEGGGGGVEYERNDIRFRDAEN